MSPEASVAPSILVADDSDTNRMLLRRQLERAGYRVTLANDGREALAKIEAERFSLVLLDVIMPELTGIEVLESVRRKYSVSDLPIIMATSMDESADIVKAFTLGANDYVTKPFDFSVVMARVRTQLALRHALEENQRLNQFIRQLFGRYVDNEIVSQLLEKPDGFSFGGEKRNVTILMADLRGFMALAEALPPENVVTMLNNYLTVMTDVIMECGGTIDEFIGDAILVLFGAPVDRPDHARAAIICALKMHMALAEVDRRNAEEGLPRAKMGVGINTGEVVVGNIGSERRTKYGVVGHNVNLASRIESYTLGGQTLVSTSTLEAAGSDVVTAGSIRVQPKGSPEPITLHSVRGVTGENLMLPDASEPVTELPSPLAVRYTVLEGKDSGGALTDAELVGLSASEAIIRGDSPELMSNVKLPVKLSAEPAEASTIYGKVTDAGEARFRVHFTSVPDDVAQRISRVLER
jgi:class 3 adenylate cyclase